MLTFAHALYLRLGGGRVAPPSRQPGNQVGTIRPGMNLLKDPRECPQHRASQSPKDRAPVSPKLGPFLFPGEPPERRVREETPFAEAAWLVRKPVIGLSRIRRGKRRQPAGYSNLTPIRNSERRTTRLGSLNWCFGIANVNCSGTFLG